MQHTRIAAIVPIIHEQTSAAIYADVETVLVAAASGRPKEVLLARNRRRIDIEFQRGVGEGVKREGIAEKQSIGRGHAEALCVALSGLRDRGRWHRTAECGRTG